MQNRPTLWKQGPNTLSVEAPAAHEVFVAGSFNGWNATSHPMKRLPGGRWVLRLDLPPGEYEYKFLIDGEWCCMPGCEKAYDSCPACIPNAYGTMNRILKVADHRFAEGPLSVSSPDCPDRAGASFRSA